MNEHCYKILFLEDRNSFTQKTHGMVLDLES